MRLNKAKIDILLNGSADQRKYACSKSLLLFAVYYFPEYLTYRLPEFHYQFHDDFEGLVNGTVKEAAWIAFRESAKTSWAKMGLVWLIAYKYKKYINVDSYDKENAERILFDVVLSLQTNGKLKNDFGELYNSARSNEESTMKRVSNFVTNNKVRVEAHSTQESVRGRLHGNQRPDFFLLDDVETAKTVDSVPVTQKIIAHIDEMKTGLAVNGSILYLGNYIIENGTVAYIMRSVEGSGGHVRFVPVVDKQGNIAWPGKYVLTDAEAFAINQELPREKHKVSLESKKRELNAGGKRVYEVEMLNDPIAAGSTFFDRRTIDMLIAKCETYREDRAGFWMWRQYNPSHRYAIGADTSMGQGRDANASVAIDFATTPALQMGSYANNEIPPDQFAYELKREGDILGTCLLAPETNAQSGGACLTTLKMIYDIGKIFRKRDDQKAMNVMVDKLGWETNGKTKHDILFGLKSAVEDGKLAISDVRILKEMRSFTYSDADNIGSTKQDMSTNHWDLLISCFAKGTMVLTDKGQRPIETLMVGDMVMTRKGYKPIISTMNSMKEVTTNIGLTGTLDHPVFVGDNETKDLSCVGKGDRLYTWDSQAQKIERLSYTEALNIIGTQTHPCERIESISRVGQLTENQQSTCIGKYGLITSETYRRVLLFITKTTIRLIMRLKTCVLCLEASTLNCTQQNQSAKNRSSKIFSKIEQRLTIVSGSIGKTSHAVRLFAVCAVKTFLQSRIMRSFVLTNAQKEHRSSESVTPSRNELALFVARFSKQVFHTKKGAPSNVLISVNGNSVERVYNIEVADQPEYFANNILVHNCAITWEMRKYAQESTETKKQFVQPAYETS